VAQVVLVLALVPGAAHAISPERNLAQLRHTSWIERDGASEGAQDIVQTNDGFLWLAARNGLLRFDGERFRRHESSAGDSSPPSAIRCLLALPDNRLLIGWQFGGVTLVREGQAVAYGEMDGLPSGSVHRMRIDGAGKLWAAVSGGLARFDGKRWERVNAEWNFAARRALILFVDRDGTLVALSDSTLMTLPKGATSFQATGVRDADYVE
jgi:ligand-binding sensor domain-containing protein